MPRFGWWRRLCAFCARVEPMIDQRTEEARHLRLWRW